MNPLTLPGPQFLAFFVGFACVVLLALYLARRMTESGPLPKLDVKDPYLFACLNGGPADVIRLAAIGLVDRGLLRASGDSIQTAARVLFRAGMPDVERELLDHCATRSKLDDVVRETRLLNLVAGSYERPLQGHGLVPDDAVKQRRLLLLAVALFALVFVGGAKLWIALAAGRSNVIILIILMVVAAIAAFKLANPYRTSLGSAYLAAVRRLFSRLRERAATIRPGGGSKDLLWLTALFGAGAVPVATFPFIRDFWPKQGSDGGSSCGSSGGGGGCGGGGGGCGGCGS